MFAPHHKISNLIAFVDNNGQQLDGYVRDVLDSGDLTAKFGAFGWNTAAVNGHDVAEICAAITAAKSQSDKPTAIILHTIKGYGAPFAEGKEFNHSMSVTAENLAEAVAAIRGNASALSGGI
jgi:transketolase